MDETAQDIEWSEGEREEFQRIRVGAGISGRLDGRDFHVTPDEFAKLRRWLDSSDEAPAAPGGAIVNVIVDRG